MRILDRYTLTPVVFTFCACIFIFLFLFVIIDILSHLEDMLNQHMSLALLTQYYLSYMPLLFAQISPFACLLSTLYTFSMLNHHNEIIAMRSSGLSIFQVIKTAVIFGAIVSLLVFWVNDRIMPSSLAQHDAITRQMDEEGLKKNKPKPTAAIINLSMYGLRNRLFFINKFHIDTQTMEGIIILEHNEEQDIIKKIIAGRGVYDGRLWKFYQSITYTFRKDGTMIGEPQYQKEEIMAIPETPQDFLNQRQQPEFMSITQLDDYIWRISRSGASTVVRGLKVQMYQRFASPFTSLIIILLGIPFALKIKRKATGLSSFGVSIMVAFIYYIVDAISISLGKGGVFPPLLAASFSHLTALTLSVSMINALS